MGSDEPRVFVIAGMPRCGTTFLYHNLQKHPAVFCPLRKETNYFSVNHHRGLAWYRALYQDINADQVGVDISPSYFLHEEAIERMTRFDPGMRVVLGVRDPVDWSLSFYGQLLTHTWMEGASFAEFIDHYDYRSSGQSIPMRLGNQFVLRTLERYRQAFGSNLLLYEFDAFKASPLRVLRAIESFLHLPEYYDESNFDRAIINAGNRRNSKVVMYIVSRDSFVSTVSRLFPRRLIQFARHRFDKLSKTRGGQNEEAYTEENMVLAEETFAAERETLQALFAEGPLQLGSGQPLEESARPGAADATSMASRRSLG